MSGVFIDLIHPRLVALIIGDYSANNNKKYRRAFI